MTEEIDDDDEEDIILDRTNLHTALSSSGPKVVFDLSQKNFGIFHNANQLSKRKTVTLALTCICIVCHEHIYYLDLFIIYIVHRVCLLVY